MSTRQPPGDDEKTEVSGPPTPDVSARPAQRRPQRRSPNPVADEVIHTGEIEAPRSLIVRRTDTGPVEQVQAQEPSVQIREDSTEQLTAIRATGQTSNRRYMWLGAAALTAATAIALVFADKGDAASAGGAAGEDSQKLALQVSAQFIGTALDSQAHAAATRAAAIAQTPMLRAALETDAQTVADMARSKDMQLPVKPGEVLEMFQLKDGQRVSLLRLPENAATLKPPEVGKSRIERDAQGLTVVATEAMTTQRAEITGEVVLALPVDLGEFKKRIGDRAQQASLIGLGAPVTVIDGKADGGTKFSLAIETESHAPLQLEVMMPAGAAGVGRSSNVLSVARYACMGLAGVLLLGFVASSRRRT